MTNNLSETADASSQKAETVQYQRYDVETIIGRTLLSEHTADQVQYLHSRSATTADTIPAGDVLSPPLADALPHDLYTHQANALRTLEDTDNIIVTTSTSSGKTLIYTLDIAEKQLQDPDSTALCIYPMKALAHDQADSLQTQLRDTLHLDTTVGVYDGDTAQSDKRETRNNADVIVTNPIGMNWYLPRHNKDDGWKRFYSNIETVVVDEAHKYTGISGTHVAWILRRIKRIITHYGGDPTFILTTATIGNPLEHAQTLTGENYTVIDTDGSPTGSRDIAVWEPPVNTDALATDTPTEQDRDAARVSPVTKTTALTETLTANEYQTLVFANARQQVEQTARQLDGRTATDTNIRPYHAGLSAAQRKTVESGLTDGTIDAVTSTNALGVGIDIGSVDATVLTGYPGTRQDFWQQVGRAGRGTDESVGVLVAGTNPLDTYVRDNPEFLFDDTVEDAVASIDNNTVYANHLLAAANELPLTRDDSLLFGPPDRFNAAVSMWQTAGVLSQAPLTDGVTYTGAKRPESRVNPYGTTNEEYEIYCTNGTLSHEPISPERAYRSYHEGAIFLHDGSQYRVTDVSHTELNKAITVKQITTNNFTHTLSTKEITSLSVSDSRQLTDDVTIYKGTGTVKIKHDMYIERHGGTGEAVAQPQSTGSPPLTITTDMMWVSLPDTHRQTIMDEFTGTLQCPDRDGSEKPNQSTEQQRRDYTYMAGIHAAEHATIALAQTVALIDTADIGGLSLPAHDHDSITGPTWFMHDSITGGVGFAHTVYTHFETIVTRAYDRLNTCNCDTDRGCPRCTLSTDCGNNNEQLDKRVAVAILKSLHGQPSSETKE